MDWLRGKRTIIAAVVTAVYALACLLGLLGDQCDTQLAVTQLSGAVLAIFMRLGIASGPSAKAIEDAIKAHATKVARPAVLLIGCAMLAACGSLPGGPLSPGTSGAPLVTTQGAGTITGQQGQAPSEAVSGTGTVNYYNAANVSSEVSMTLLEMAKEAKWTPEQIRAALTALAGAPDTVNINGSASVVTGDSAAIGSGTGGGAGAAGASTVNRP